MNTAKAESYDEVWRGRNKRSSSRDSDSEIPSNVPELNTCEKIAALSFREAIGERKISILYVWIAIHIAPEVSPGYPSLIKLLYEWDTIAEGMNDDEKSDFYRSRIIDVISLHWINMLVAITKLFKG